MLKVKDDVDLKELEKYGWKHNGQHTFIKHSNNQEVHFGIEEDTKIITMLTQYWRDDLDIIYDLIKADLIEKVDE